MNNTEKMDSIGKVKKILKTINLMVEKSQFFEDENGLLFFQDIEDIIKEQKLFENIDIKRISLLNKNYITIEEFKTSEIFYDILYKIFLNFFHKLIQSSEKTIIKIPLFNTFNQAYFYNKFIKYMYLFIDKYQETLNDDIIKIKIFEIVHSLQSSEKIYIQDFYFYISMFTIHYYYKNNDVSFPEFEKFNENHKMWLFLLRLKDQKLNIINTVIYYLKIINSKSNLIKLLSLIKKEIEENKIFNNDNYDDFNWDKIITESEKKLFKYLNENNSDNDIIKLYEYLDNYNKNKKNFQFYYLDGMKSFLSLNEEDKYVIVNSYNMKEEFPDQIMNYIDLKKSYDEGMKKENILIETIKNIIEDEQFFEDIRDIFTSEKVANYCKNPLKYSIGHLGIQIYDEKEKDLVSNILLDGDLEVIKEAEYKYQYYLDYDYFIKNIFDKNLLKEKIIYSFLPYGIKSYISLIPKIQINICSNNIKLYNIETNYSENYKTILKGLYTVIIIQELINFIRRKNPYRPLTYENSLKENEGNYEEGMLFIYHIFGDLAVIYMDLELAKVILKKESWKIDCKNLKEQFIKFKNKNDDEIIESFKEKELIKCYDSIIEIKYVPIEDYDFCCRICA